MEREKDRHVAPRKIIIDTDPGQDDAVAILLALASPEEIEVLGVVAVAGNVPLPLTQKNARIVCELAGRSDIPVFAGADAPGEALYCSMEDIAEVLADRLKGKDALLQASLEALRAGAGQ